MTHCEMFQTEEIQVIIGDASRDGVGGRQYCGIWSLTSKHRVFNAFGNSYAGLIPGELRGKAPVLKVTGTDSAELVRSADEHYPVDACARYVLKSPNIIEHTLTFTDHKDVRGQGCDFREVSWCCYINSPEDPRIHFLSEGEWYRYISPQHGIGSNIAPAYISDDQLERWAPREGRRPFHWDRISRRFDKPFYYGRLGNMVLILIFGRPEWLRFFCSPSGGGGSLLSGKSCPAWDFEWVIPNEQYEVGREYELKMRLVYKQFVSDEDVVAEYQTTCNALGIICQ